MMKFSSSNIWLFNGLTDLLVLFLPVWCIWIACFLLPESLLNADISLWVWVIVVIGIDVSHVWSTIFRTYFDKEEFSNHRKLLIYSPLLVFVFFFMVAGFSQVLFWTILAYVALYHFIKQQYGFLRLYKAKFGKVEKGVLLKDEWMIYITMLYPVVYWHFSPQRNFEWFVEGDFIQLTTLLSQTTFDQITVVLNTFYWLLILVWVIQEYLLNRNKFPLGKVLWTVTTAGNWYIGIVYFNSDLAFTLTNVVAHGLPYLALVFYYVEKKKQLKSGAPSLKAGSAALHILLMILAVLFLALGEEYLWDMFLYRDNELFFEKILPFPLTAFESTWLQAFAFAALTVPQATHYILDGYIWKGNAKNPYVRQVLIGK